MPHPKSVHTRPFGVLNDTKEATLYTLRNDHGVSASLTNYGATLVALNCPDRNGRMADIVLGFDNVNDYVKSGTYIGATVGRYANRIGGAAFEIEGKRYSLDANNGPNSLHGGLDGFNRRLWHAEIIDADCPTVRFSLFSPDGDQGFPGNMTIHVTYSLNNENALSIHVDATSDASTPISITNHSYFNLAGKGPIDDHWLHIPSDRYTPLNDDQIPTGEFASVENTPFDFTAPHQVGERINADHPQIKIGGGYDHNFITSAKAGAEPVEAAMLEHKESGRILRAYTNAPGIQLYTANFLGSDEYGKGVTHHPRHSLCLEPQHIPNTPNNSDFPSCILNPGERYRHTMVFHCSVSD